MSHRQSGSTLAISLILLLVFTLVGMASISHVTFNQKMSANYRESDLAFQAAEAALLEGEAFAEILSVDVLEDHFDDACSGAECFTATCNDGRCFNGDYSPGELCEIDEPATALAKVDATWTTEGRARSAQINFPGLAEPPKYIIEFLCYVQTDPDQDPVTLTPPPGYDLSQYSYFYRVTSYAKGSNGTSRAMLQSTYKVNRL